MDSGSFCGPLEIEFLEMWLLLHPEIAVDSAEESMDKDDYW